MGSLWLLHRQERVVLDLVELMDRKGTHHTTLSALASCLVTAARSCSQPGKASCT